MPETSLETSLDILVVDDSPTYRMILTRVLRGWPKANLVGTAGDGMAALSAIREKHPQLVLLDISMPVLDGIETMRRIRQNHEDVDVIMLSGLDASQTGLTMQALSLGALDFVPKPQGESPSESFSTLSACLFPLLELAAVRHRRRLNRMDATNTSRPMPTAHPRTPKQESPAQTPVSPVLRRAPIAQPPAGQRSTTEPEPISVPRITPGPVLPAREPTSARPIARTGRKPPARIELVAIGVSTGGPNALHALVPRLPADFPVPLLCVQHMPPLFTASLAERLDRESALTVVEAIDGSTLEPGTLYIAPGGSHMVVAHGLDGRLLLSMRDDPPVHSCRPSVDVLFESIAEICPSGVIAVVLTGMGCDGAEGVKRLRSKGAWSVVQDEASSVVWGMPGAVHSAGEADETLPLDSIADRLTEIVKHRGVRS